MPNMFFDRVAARLFRYSRPILAAPDYLKKQTSDIRFKSGQPIALCGTDGVFFLKESGEASRALVPGLLRVGRRELQELFLAVCGHSVFSHEAEICQGYVDMGGGCRAGLGGTAVVEKGRVTGMRDVTSLVFRIPRDVPGCGDRLFLEGVDPLRGVLIAGAPASGKTTLLRDIARSLSLGRFGPSRRVAVLDTRGELAGSGCQAGQNDHDGLAGSDWPPSSAPAWDLGPCADVLLGWPKAQGFSTALRTLSPEVIVCDELAPEDLESVQGAVFAGAALVATVHGGMEQAYSRPLCRRLMETGAFGALVTLGSRENPGAIAAIERLGQRESRAG